VQLALVVASSGVGSGIVALILFGIAEPVSFSIEHAVKRFLDRIPDHFPEVVAYCAFIELDYLRLFSRMIVHGSVLLCG
jgi:hypothetical protein